MHDDYYNLILVPMAACFKLTKLPEIYCEFQGNDCPELNQYHLIDEIGSSNPAPGCIIKELRGSPISIRRSQMR